MRIFQPLHNVSICTLPMPTPNTNPYTYPKRSRITNSNVIKVPKPVVTKTFKHVKHNAPVYTTLVSSSSQKESTEHDYVVLDYDMHDSPNDEFVFI
jgi:hypothetical protein